MKNLGLPKQRTPNFWWMLNPLDMRQYQCLQFALTAGDNKNQRNRRIATFQEAIEAVKVFAIRGDMNDKIRCLVCGIAWLPEGLAINTHQLRLLISRCKSSINGSFQKLEYTEYLGRTDAANAMIQAFPFLKEHPSELRKWSIRRKPTKDSNSGIRAKTTVKEITPIPAESMANPKENDLWDTVEVSLNTTLYW